MKTSILILTMTLSSLLFNNSLSANNPSKSVDSKPWQMVIASHLNGLDIRTATKETNKLFVDFIVNEKNEIVVVSTSDKGLDDSIKSKLNYKKINPSNLEYNVKYTLPVIVKI